MRRVCSALVALPSAAAVADPGFTVFSTIQEPFSLALKEAFWQKLKHDAVFNEGQRVQQADYADSIRL